MFFVSPVTVRRGPLSALLVLCLLLLLAVGCGEKGDEKAAGQGEKGQSTQGVASPDKAAEKAAAAAPATQKGNGTPAAQTPPPKVKVVEAKAMPVPIFVEYSASIQAKDSVDIRARVAGYLQERHFEEGGLVKQGDLLFTIDPSEYNEALKQAQSVLQGNQASLEKAKTDYQRFGALVQQGAISREEFDAKTTTMKQYEAMVSENQAAVKQAELNLGYTKITAPIAGRIGRAQAQAGDLVGRGDNTLLATITTVDPIYVNFSISEQDYLRHVKHVQEQGWENEIDVLLKLADGNYYKQSGTINMVDPAVDTKTGTLGARAVFPNPQGLLLPGQYGRVLLVVHLTKESILIPQRALMDVQGIKQVLVADKAGQVQSKVVTLGQDLGSVVVVAQGLTPGDLVLVEGLQKIKAGMSIEPDVQTLDLGPLAQVVEQGAPAPSAPAPGAPAETTPAETTPAPADTAAPAGSTGGGAQQ